MYLVQKEEAEAGVEQLRIDTRKMLDVMIDKVDQEIEAENAAIAYDTHCVLNKIIFEIQGKINFSININ